MLTTFDDLEEIVGKLMKRVARCILSNNIQNTKTAICLFQNDNFIKMNKKYKSVIYPILVPPVYYQSLNHPANDVKKNLEALLTILKLIDKDLYEKSFLQN